MGQPMPPKVKRTLELNPQHALVTGLRDGPRADGRRTRRWSDTAHLLYGMALLAEGGELAEPAAFVSVLSRAAGAGDALKGRCRCAPPRHGESCDSAR